MREVCATHPDADCYADKNVTSRDLEDSGVTRMTRTELRKKTEAWLVDQRIAWRGNVDECKRNGAYKWTDTDEWRHQFSRVDPELGPRVAAAILTQLRIVSIQELGDFLTDGLEDASHSTYFMGADPNTGDHGVATILNQRIDNKTVIEAFKLQKPEPGASIRMFNDGGWSGGESLLRLKCLYKECGRKTCHIEPTQSFQMRFAFITDIAENALLESIRTELPAMEGAISLSYPPENRLRLETDEGVRKGLAFRNPDISRYVDPIAMEALCKRIGKKLSGRRPLGTHRIASTIGFWHSLPKAMLPLLIMGGGPVRASNGEEFPWRPLIISQHVLAPAKDDPDYHCQDCPLAPRPAAAANPTTTANVAEAKEAATSL